MYTLYPFVTKDGSVGLYNPCEDDIYHSVAGAASEAYEKFIFPAEIENFFQNHDCIRVLDICFGIGYNSKSFLNFIFQNKFKNFSKNNNLRGNILSPYHDKIYGDNSSRDKYNETIYSDNIIKQSYNGKIYSDNIQDKKSRELCNEQIYADNVDKDKCKNSSNGVLDNFRNKNIKIFLKAIDTDKNLACLAPFINSNLNQMMKNQYKNDKISKFLSKKFFNPVNFEFAQALVDSSCKNCENYNAQNLFALPEFLTSYPPAINLFLYERIISCCPEIINSSEFIRLLYDKKYKGYFNSKLRRLFKLKCLSMGKLTLQRKLCSFLHNIYYRNLSERYKNDLKALKTLEIDFSLKTCDARLEIKSDTNTYDFIFLDAFTPSKCPCLWTLDFFEQLYSHLSRDGIILTYSNAAPVRNAFWAAGFFVGKIYNPVENKFTGTIAAKNQSLIKYPLSEFDLGLLKTKAGIVYRDENLTDLNEAIIERRNFEVKNSDLISSTKYMKTYK